MEFSTLHKYRRLARRGLVEPLVCNVCHNEYILRVGPEDQPALSCEHCHTLRLPGSALFGGVERELARVEREKNV